MGHPGTIRDVPLSLCPGTKKFPRPAVPLSRDKKSFLVTLSLCPGTEAAAAKIPRRHYLVVKKNVRKSEKLAIFYFFFKNCIFACQNPVRPASCPGFWQKNSDCPIPRPVPDFDRLSWPVLSHCKILSLSRCPFVPGQWRNFCPFVPKSCTVPSRWKS